MSNVGTRIYLAHDPTLNDFLGRIEPEFDDDYSYVWFSLKSIVHSHLNHSNRIRNEEVMAEIQKLVEF